jgi:Ca-activated chloride channel family protein
VKLGSQFPTQTLIELPFPSSLGVVNNLLFSYLDKQAPHAHTYYVLDTSGSMQGSRLNALKAAMLNLTGQDTSLAGQFSRFRDGETVSIIQFSDQVRPVKTFHVVGTNPDGAARVSIRKLINGLQADGSTYLYEALSEAYDQALADHKANPANNESIVLLTDGEANGDMDLGGFEQYYRDQLGEDATNIRTFTVLFGDGSSHDMSAIADLTGGKVFNGQKESLEDVFREIRGYQ